MKVTEEAAVINFVRALLIAGSLVSLPLMTASPAQSQGYPNRPIKMIVPFPAGGPTDGMARVIADRLGAVLGQSIVIENKGGGAGGSVGAKFVAASHPDGYTIMLTPAGTLTSGPAVFRHIGYDPVKAFAPIALLIETPQIIYANPSLPVRTLADLEAYAKANPGVSWGSQGFGTAPHLLAEVFNLQTHAGILHVPFRGSAPMQAAVISNHIQVAAGAASGVLPQILSGQVRALALASRRRSTRIPDVPTAADAGYPELVVPFWFGVVAPADTPPEVIDKLNAALRESLASPDAKEGLGRLGAEIRIGTPAEFGRVIVEELGVWTEVARAANLSVE